MKTRQNARLKPRAFTLIEMVLVLAIVALLVGAGAVALVNVLGTGQETRARADVQKISAALRSYQINNRFLPTEAQGLKALVERPTSAPQPKRWKKEISPLPIDPWGFEYKYRRPAKKSDEDFDVFSVGEDGQADTDDDIGNWEDA